MHSLKVLFPAPLAAGQRGEPLGCGNVVATLMQVSFHSNGQRSIQRNCTAIEAFGPPNKPCLHCVWVVYSAAIAIVAVSQNIYGWLSRFCVDSKFDAVSRRIIGHIWGHWARSVSAWYMTASLVTPGCPDPRDNSSRKSPLKAEKE